MKVLTKIEVEGCVFVRKTERESGVLAAGTNKAVVFDHMILYISCSVGCWTASTAHNIDNMFHMNPAPHCQGLATNATPAS